MKVFISWSKQPSQTMARHLREWLPEVIQQIDPWVSTEDIAKGKRWSAEISGQLDATSQGLVCVTRANMQEPWLNFEAGALAKSLESSQVRPVLLDVAPHEVTGPLAEFQATESSDVEDMFRLVESLNTVCESPLTADRLRRAFDRAWPDLEERLAEARQAVPSDRMAGEQVGPSTSTRSAEDMLSEVLDRIRGVEREMNLIGRDKDGSSRVLSSKQEREIVDIVDSKFSISDRPRSIQVLPESVLIAFETEPEDLSTSISELLEPLAKRGIDGIEASFKGNYGKQTIAVGRLQGKPRRLDLK